MDVSNQESASVFQENAIKESVLQKNVWQSVDPSYKTLLRLYVAIQILVVIPIAIFFILIMQETAKNVLMGLIVVYFLVALWQLCVWAPKTACRLQYLLHDDDINLQKGFIYWRQVSVACNRIQHLEVSQGPLERHLGLATLSVFTAGTLGSDMKLPGLKLQTATNMKFHLLDKINAEELDVDESL